MRIQPDGTNLLDTVAALLRDQILPGASADQQYALRMSINAIGIARRQLASGDQGEQRARERIVQLLGDKAGEEPVRGLAHMIRQGAARNHPELQQLLWDITWHRARESAPRYLQQEKL